MFKFGDSLALLAYARTAKYPPEARLLAVTCIEAMWELAVRSPEARPSVKPKQA